MAHSFLSFTKNLCYTTYEFGLFPPCIVNNLCSLHTLSIAFQHLPPNSARFGYATQGALSISMQLSADTVSAFRKVWVLIKLRKQPSAQART